MASVKNSRSLDWERKVLQSDVLTVVDFWHENCAWCLKFNPVFDDVANEYKGKASFMKLDVMESPAGREIAIRYGVMSTPTVVFFCKGLPVGHVLGFKSSKDFREILDQMLEKHKECLGKSTPM